MEKNRVKKVISKMKEQNLTQIIISATASIYYLTGFWVEPHERMIALYLDQDGRAVLFGNEIFGLEAGDDLEYFVHSDHDNPVEHLSKIVHTGTIGIDKFWSSKFLIGLMDARPDIKPQVGSAPVDEARMVKDKKEIEAMRHASAINDKVVTMAIEAIKDGIRENELASLVNRNFLSFGADAEGTQLVCFGANGADPHHGAGSSTISCGESVIFDIFTPINHYWCDMTRTVFYKEANEEQHKVYELVRRANVTAEEAIKPGMKFSQIDRIAREIIADGGYGKYFTHRLGHNIGLDCHEPPDVSTTSQTILEPGMIFSIEPGIYLPGKFGVRIEDLVLVTENGCEVLNKATKDLQIIGK